MKKRNNAFDLLCGLCILRMVMLHVMCMTHMEKTSWWREVMFWTFFFMSFFFFKAGYFNKGVTGKTLPYLKDRVLRLFVPYVSWGIISAVLAFFWFCFRPYSPEKAIGMLTEFRWYVGGLTFGNAPLWFLLSFFTTYVVMHFIERVPYLHWIVLVFPAIGYWLFLHDNPLWFYLSNVFCGTFFFYLGKVWHFVLERITKHFALFISILFCIGFVFANIYLHGEYKMKPNVWVAAPWKSMLIVFLSLCGFSGVLLSWRTPRIPFINYVGEHSMVYFVMHYPVLLSYAHICGLFGHGNMRNYLDISIMMILAFGVCTYAVPHMERVPWLSGRWNTK